MSHPPCDTHTGCECPCHQHDCDCSDTNADVCLDNQRAADEDRAIDDWHEATMAGE